MIIEEAKKQWVRPMDDFKWNVKCCWNCPHWQKDTTLMGDYAYNFCDLTKNQMTIFDNVCEQYSGVATEENLIVTLTNEERQRLKLELGN